MLYTRAFLHFCGVGICYTGSIAISDTDPEAQRIQDELIRTMPAWRTLELMDDLYQMARHLALEGLRELYPMATEAELKRLSADLQLGPELAQKVYGPTPDVSKKSPNYKK